MTKIQNLEFQRLITELQFVESDYLYQSEILRLSDIEFLKSLEALLDKNLELKEIYYKKQDEFYKNIIDVSKENLNVVSEEIEILPRKEFSEGKKLYRDIVKTTHPDKIKNIKLNNLYLEATEAYEKNDIVTLYKVCTELNIEFEIMHDYINEIKSKIESYRNRVSFLENTWTFKWAKTDNKEKDKILIDFIRSKVV